MSLVITCSYSLQAMPVWKMSGKMFPTAQRTHSVDEHKEPAIAPETLVLVRTQCNCVTDALSQVRGV
jgi:hypothetical protein